MKTKTAILLILVSGFSLLLRAQSIDPTSAWRVNSTIWDPPEMRFTFYKDYINGDTTINARTYKKIFMSGYWYISEDPNQTHYPFNTLHGFLREEGNRWYTFYNNTDTLLIDFTLGINDTVYSPFNFTMGSAVTVTAIDSVLAGTVYKKRMHLSTENGLGADYIIEGIGATSGLFEDMVFFEWDSEVVCFAVNGESVWGAPSEECDLNVGIKENNGETGFKLYPNPAAGSVFISLPEDLGEAEITVMDPHGITVFSGSYAGPSMKITLTGYHAGLYLVRAGNGNTTLSKKLILD